MYQQFSKLFDFCPSLCLIWLYSTRFESFINLLSLLFTSPFIKTKLRNFITVKNHFLAWVQKLCKIFNGGWGVAQKSLINRCSVLDTDLYIVPKAIYILYNWSLIVLCEVVFKASIGRRVECRISVVIYSDKIYMKLSNGPGRLWKWLPCIFWRRISYQTLVRRRKLSKTSKIICVT